MTRLYRHWRVIALLLAAFVVGGIVQPTAYAWPNPAPGAASADGVWNVADFSPNGLCNSSYIQQTLNSANSAGTQATVYVPSATCTITSTVTIPAKISLTGAPTSTVFNAASGLSGPMVTNATNAGGISIKSIQFNGNQSAAASATDCIQITGGTGSGIVLQDVWANNCKSDGIRLSGVTRVSLSAVTASTNQANGIDVLGASTGVGIVNSAAFDNNQASGTAGVAIAGTTLGTSITNLYAYDDQGGSATQLLPVAEASGANSTVISGLYASGNVTSQAASLTGASSRVNDLSLNASSNNTYSGGQTYNGAATFNSTVNMAGSTGLTLTDVTAPAAPGAGKTGVYTVSGLPHYRAGAAGSDIALADVSSAQTITGKSIAASEVNSGQLAAANGGTGAASLTQFGVLCGGGTGAVTSITPDASSTKVLTSGGSSACPTWAAAATGNPTLISLGMNTAAALSVPQFLGAGGTNTNEALVKTPMTQAVTLTKLALQLSGTPTQTVTATLRKGGVAQAITCSTTTAVCIDVAHTVTFAAGDNFDVSVADTASDSLAASVQLGT